MLNVFMYFNEDMVDALFLAAVQQLSRIVAGGGATLQEAQRLWRSFLESAIFTYVEGDPPNPTDSGLLFARKARQVLGIDQRQIVPPVVALDQASSNPETCADISGRFCRKRFASNTNLAERVYSDERHMQFLFGDEEERRHDILLANYSDYLRRSRNPALVVKD